LESGTGFDKTWFLADFEAYAWGIAIALVVNVVVYPITAERQLRKLLVTSLQHVSTLAHLSCKTYAKECSEDEAVRLSLFPLLSDGQRSEADIRLMSYISQEVRQLLIKTIRADYLALATRLQETSFEILYTRWSLKHYSDMIASVQGLQQALITSSSALDLIDRLDPEGVNVKRHLLARAEVAKTFTDFRHGIDLVISEIIDQLVETRTLDQALAQSNQINREATSSGDVTPNGGNPQKPAELPKPDANLHTETPTPQAQKKLETVAAKLKREVQRSEMRHEEIRSASASMRSYRGSPSRRGLSPSQSGKESPVGSPTSARFQSSSLEVDRGRWAAFRAELEETANEREKKEARERNVSFDTRREDAATGNDEPIPGELSSHQEKELEEKDKRKARQGDSSEDSVLLFRKAWDAFAQAQSDALVSLIKDGALEVEDVLRIEDGMPSLAKM